MQKKPRILVLASGSATGGGSGFQELVEFSRTDPPVLDAEIVGVGCNHPEGGVYQKAQTLGVPFDFGSGPFTGGWYRRLKKKYGADHVTCSGWLPYVRGLDPATTTNIHPGALPAFGGKGMYGHHVHEATIKAFREGRVKQSAVTMHFVTEEEDDEYDRGPIILQYPILIRPNDTAESLGERVNEKERAIQAHILNRVVHGMICLENGRVVMRDRRIRHSSYIL